MGRSAAWGVAAAAVVMMMLPPALPAQVQTLKDFHVADVENRDLVERFVLPIAGGETEFTRFGFREIFINRSLDIIQPNVSRSGGFTECMRIAALADAFHIPYAPHTGSTTGVCHAAELHLAAALPNFLIYESMEYDWSKYENNPLRSDLLIVAPSTRTGSYFSIPVGPGLGVELNEDTVEKYRISKA